MARESLNEAKNSVLIWCYGPTTLACDFLFARNFKNNFFTVIESNQWNIHNIFKKHL